MKRLICSLAFLLVVLVIAGCSSAPAEREVSQEPVGQKPAGEEPKGEQPANEELVSQDPVTISILNWNALSEEEFERYYVEAVSEIHPHITLELVPKESGAAADAIAKHIMSGEVPDIIYVSNKDINNFIAADVIHNLEELVRKNDYDLERIIAPAVTSVQKQEVGLAAIPWAQNVGAIAYNKDIFDQFGVEYPKDLMSWEEVLTMARNLTRVVDNEQYLGFKPSSLSQFGQSLSVSYVSPEGKALVDTPTWHRILNYYKDLYDIPGYDGDYSGSVFGSKTVAMEATWLSTIQINARNNPDFNWDVSGLPNFEEFLGIGREVDAHTLAISTTSEHKEQAFQVIEVVTSDEIQGMMSRYGRAPLLDNEEILSDFGSDTEDLAGKNWDAVFAVTPGELRENATVHDSMVLRMINPLAERIRTGDSDINTMLREVQQEADAALQAELN